MLQMSMQETKGVKMYGGGGGVRERKFLQEILDNNIYYSFTLYQML